MGVLVHSSVNYKYVDMKHFCHWTLLNGFIFYFCRHAWPTCRPIFESLCFTCQIIAISLLGNFKIYHSRLKGSHWVIWKSFLSSSKNSLTCCKKVGECGQLYVLRLSPYLLWSSLYSSCDSYCHSLCRNCIETQSCSLFGYVTAAVQAAAHVCGRLHRVQFVTQNHERHMSL